MLTRFKELKMDKDDNGESLINKQRYTLYILVPRAFGLELRGAGKRALKNKVEQCYLRKECMYV